MTAVLQQIQARGVTLRLAGDRLQARGPVTPDVRELIRQHRDELVAMLDPARDPYAIAEREAIQNEGARTLEDLGLVQVRPGVWEHPSVEGLDFGEAPPALFG